MPSALFESLANLRPPAQRKFKNIFAGGMAVGKNQPSTAGNPCVGQPVLSVLCPFLLGGRQPHRKSKKEQNPLENPRLSDAKQFCRSRNRRQGKNPQRNTLCILKAETQYEAFPPGKNAYFLLSMRQTRSQTCERRRVQRGNRIFSHQKEPYRQGSFSISHHSRLWGLFFTGGV